MGTQNLSMAADMLEMEWDAELAAVAQKYANQCRYKHDKANCRQVGNFNVGQNLAIQTLTGGHTAPQPDWNFAVSIWYSEIGYFHEKDIYPFNLPTGAEYRHFSQVNWATSFRVGCGYVLYKSGQDITSQVLTRLYVCNYGPAGNVYGDSVWKKGQFCSACPINSCCGSSCSNGTIYNGLCKRTDNEAPLYPAPMPNLFYCSFRGENDCDNYIEGKTNWEILPTLGGNYLGIVLNGGENSTINFKKEIQPTQSQFCITLSYRKGPNVDGQPDAGLASEVLKVPDIGYVHSQPLVSYEDPERQQFSIYNLTLSWKDTTLLALNFAVPPGKTAQFFDVDAITITDGKCQNKMKK
ncbi:hypothetical protein JTE90_014704 [Oedothorax gibbosus]|uniref:SCP domain-containing protein n=1 Tax=Oedothorax gibbosus TaxID=931172 RepID=A0AAV6U2K7_9ARAC|nr:hypothetical protein JTE90_014704 [Oedothorax gibbosus]